MLKSHIHIWIFSWEVKMNDERTTERFCWNIGKTNNFKEIFPLVKTLMSLVISWNDVRFLSSVVVVVVMLTLKRKIGFCFWLIVVFWQFEKRFFDWRKEEKFFCSFEGKHKIHRFCLSVCSLSSVLFSRREEKKKEQILRLRWVERRQRRRVEGKEKEEKVYSVDVEPIDRRMKTSVNTFLLQFNVE